MASRFNSFRSLDGSNVSHILDNVKKSTDSGASSDEKTAY